MIADKIVAVMLILVALWFVLIGFIFGHTAIAGGNMPWNEYVGISSVIIALCAFVLTFTQTIFTVHHNKLSVTPHLTTWENRDAANNRYSIKILNNGIGPALIESFEIEIDGQRVAGDKIEKIENAAYMLFSQYPYSLGTGYMAKGYMMPAEECRDFVDIIFVGPNIPDQAQVLNTVSRARLLIEYKSIYKRKYKLDTDKEA